MVDFSLSLTDAFGGLAPAEEKQKLRAANRELFTFYGLQLSQEDCEMLVQSAQHSMQENGLVAVGGSITPRLIHWFLQGGYIGRHYAVEFADLTDIFYRVKAELQEICEENRQTECMLSDNAILFYMYRFYVSPNCGGDINTLSELMSQIIIPAMNRLVHLRNKKKKIKLKDIKTYGDPVYCALYADEIAAARAANDYEERVGRERRDALFRSVMMSDPHGYRSAVSDYDARYDDPAYDPEEDLYAVYDDEAPVFGMFAEELDELLRHNPELLLPGEELEAEWANTVEQWADDDAAVADLYQ